MLDTFFSTVAQISFTVAGLILVAIAGDSNTRRFWFGHRLRSNIAALTLLLVLLPGLISITGLIPTPGNSIPAWPFSTFGLGVFYLVLSMYFARRQRSKNSEEALGIDASFANPNPMMRLSAFGLVVTATIGLWTYYTSFEAGFVFTEILLALILSLSILVGAPVVLELIISQTDFEAKDSRKSESLDDTKEGPRTANHTIHIFTDEGLSLRRRDEKVPGAVVAITLLTAVAAFLFGVLISKEVRKDTID